MHRPTQPIPQAGKAGRKRGRPRVGTRPQKPKRTSAATASCRARLPPRLGAPAPAAGPAARAQRPRAAAGAPPARCSGPASAPLPPLGLDAAQGGGFRGLLAPGFRLQVHTGGPAARPPPARPHAAPRPRPPILLHSCGRPAPPPPPPAQPPSPSPAARLAGGRGAGTFPRPAARAAHRWRCRRGPGARPGQSGRAGRGGAAAARAPVSPPGLPRPRRLLPTSGGRRAPAEPTHRRRAGAGAGGGRRVRPGPRPGPRPSPEPLPISGARGRTGGGQAVAREPRSRPRPLSRPLHSPPSPGPWEGAQRGKGMVEF